MRTGRGNTGDVSESTNHEREAWAYLCCDVRGVGIVGMTDVAIHVKEIEANSQVGVDSIEISGVDLHARVLAAADNLDAGRDRHRLTTATPLPVTDDAELPVHCPEPGVPRHVRVEFCALKLAPKDIRRPFAKHLLHGFEGIFRGRDGLVDVKREAGLDVDGDDVVLPQFAVPSTGKLRQAAFLEILSVSDVVGECDTIENADVVVRAGHPTHADMIRDGGVG